MKRFTKLAVAVTAVLALAACSHGMSQAQQTATAEQEAPQVATQLLHEYQPLYPYQVYANCLPMGETPGETVPRRHSGHLSHVRVG
jgi:hypothetical protein